MRDLDELVESKYYFRPQEQRKCRVAVLRVAVTVGSEGRASMWVFP